jgi:hypothetical protein
MAAIPIVRQPHLVPFDAWRVQYAYFVDCIVENIRRSMSSVPFNLQRLRGNLEKYLYRTGRSKFRSFPPPLSLSGPRPRRHPKYADDGFGDDSSDGGDGSGER